MKIFLSWSGEKSHKVAIILRDWLPSVLQSVKPYVSSEDIDKGSRWSVDIAKELEDSAFGILCVTKDNINAPWLTFEAGALSKTMDKTSVTPFLFDIKRSEVSGPMLQFQSTIFERDDLEKLVSTINKKCTDGKLEENRLSKTFDVWYEDLETNLKKIENIGDKGEETEEVPRDDTSSEIMEEVLEISRINQKLMRGLGNVDSDSIKNLSNQINEINSKIERLAERMRFQRISTIERPLNNNQYDMLLKYSDAELRCYAILSHLKYFIPWIYDYGINIIKDIKNGNRRNSIYKNIDVLISTIKNYTYELNMHESKILKSSMGRGLNIEDLLYELQISLDQMIHDTSTNVV